MAAGIHIISLVVLLSEVVNISALPRARRSVYPEEWHEATQTRKDGRGYGSRRPLHYIRSVRQRGGVGRAQPRTHSDLHLTPWQRPSGHSWKVHSNIQKPSQPGLFHHTQVLHRDTEVWTKGPPPQQTPPPPPKNLAQFKPKGFQFSFNIPFANLLGQIKDVGPQTKGVNGGGSHSATSSQSYRPTNVQIHSAFSGPSAAHGTKGSPNSPDASTEPSFQLSLSVPIPSPTPVINVSVQQQQLIKPLELQDGGSRVTPVLKEHHILPEHSSHIQTEQNLGFQHYPTVGTVGTHSVQEKPVSTDWTRLSGPVASSDPPGAYQSPAQPAPDYQVQPGAVHRGDYSVQPNPTTPDDGRPPPSGNIYGHTQGGDSRVISFPKEHHTPSKQSIQIQDGYNLHFQEYSAQSQPVGDYQVQHGNTPIGYQYAPDDGWKPNRHMASSNPTGAYQSSSQYEQSPREPHQLSASGNYHGDRQDGESGVIAAPKEHHIYPEHGSQIQTQRNLGFQQYATRSLPLPNYQIQQGNTHSGHYSFQKHPATSEGKKPSAHMASLDTAGTHQSLLQNGPSPSHYLQLPTGGTDHDQTGRPMHSMHILVSSETAVANQAPSQPVPDYQVQAGTTHSGYYSVQANPTTSTDWKKPSASDPTGAHHSPFPYEQPLREYLQIPASGNDRGQTEQPTSSQQIFEQHNNGQLQPFVYGQKPETSHTADSRQFGVSHSPSESSAGRSGHALLPGQLTAVEHLPKFQGLPAEAQASLPEKQTDTQQLHEKPNYAKLFIDIEEKLDSVPANNFAPQAHQYNAYMGAWPGHNMAEPPSERPQWLLPSKQHPSSVFGHEQKGYDGGHETQPNSQLDDAVFEYTQNLGVNNGGVQQPSHIPIEPLTPQSVPVQTVYATNRGTSVPTNQQPISYQNNGRYFVK